MRSVACESRCIRNIGQTANAKCPRHITTHQHITRRNHRIEGQKPPLLKISTHTHKMHMGRMGPHSENLDMVPFILVILVIIVIIVNCHVSRTRGPSRSSPEWRVEDGRQRIEFVYVCRLVIILKNTPGVNWCRSPREVRPRKAMDAVESQRVCKGEWGGGLAVHRICKKVLVLGFWCCCWFLVSGSWFRFLLEFMHHVI